MSEISPIGPGTSGPASSPSSSNGVAHGEVEFKPRPSERLADRVELSERARFLDRMRELPAVRQDVVRTVRDAIAAGEYSIDDKLGLAVERLLDDLDEA